MILFELLGLGSYQTPCFEGEDDNSDAPARAQNQTASEDFTEPVTTETEEERKKQKEEEEARRKAEEEAKKAEEARKKEEVEEETTSLGAAPKEDDEDTLTLIGAEEEDELVLRAPEDSSGKWWWDAESQCLGFTPVALQAADGTFEWPSTEWFTSQNILPENTKNICLQAPGKLDFSSPNSPFKPDKQYEFDRVVFDYDKEAFQGTPHVVGAPNIKFNRIKSPGDLTLTTVYDPGKIIPRPSFQGTLYLENCYFNSGFDFSGLHPGSKVCLDEATYRHFPPEEQFRFDEWARTHPHNVDPRCFRGEGQPVRTPGLTPNMDPISPGPPQPGRIPSGSPNTPATNRQMGTTHIRVKKGNQYQG